MSDELNSKNVTPQQPNPTPEPEATSKTTAMGWDYNESYYSLEEQRGPRLFTLGLILLTALVLSLLAIFTDWSWRSWQWILGTVAGTVLLFALVPLVFAGNEKNSSLLQTLPFAISTVNFFLFILFRENYAILFGCICLLQMLCIFLVSLGTLCSAGLGGFIVFLRNLLVFCWNAFGFLFAVIGVHNISWQLSQWVLGIGGGLFFLFSLRQELYEIETQFDFCAYRLGTIVLGAIILSNLPLLLWLGEPYEWIFFCVSALEMLGGVLLAKQSLDDIQLHWTTINIVEIVLPIVETLLLLFGIVNWDWKITQWILGIGGGLVLSVVCVAVVLILEENYTWNISPLGAIFLGAIFLVNLALYLCIGANYKVIFSALSAFEALGAGILAFSAFVEDENKTAWLFILAIVFFILSALLPALRVSDWPW